MPSPNMLKKEFSSIPVTRLNNYPIAVAVVIGMVIFLACYYAIHKKMAQQAESQQNSTTISSTGRDMASVPDLTPTEQEPFSKHLDPLAGKVEALPLQPVQVETFQQPEIDKKILARQKAMQASSTVEVSNQYSPASTGQSGYLNRGPGDLNGDFSPAFNPKDLMPNKEDFNLQERKEKFAQSKSQSSGYLSSRREYPVSPYEIKRGSIIPGIMITGINSDLPGLIKGQVSQNVYDTATGNYLLIPQGTSVVGTYDSFISLGQERAMVVWTSLVFPDGSVLDLERMAGADQSGYSGFHDQVNHHYMKLFGSAVMLSLVGAGYQLSQPDAKEGSPSQVMAGQLAQQLNQVGTELLRKNMQIQPTLEIRPGFKFNVMVHKDIILEPYKVR